MGYCVLNKKAIWQSGKISVLLNFIILELQNFVSVSLARENLRVLNEFIFLQNLNILVPMTSTC